MSIVMNIGVVVFAILFAFLLFIAILCFSALLKQNTIPTKPKKHPRISVLVPAYNEQEHITECLQSLVDTRYPADKREIVLVDDGSTDRTVELAQRIDGVRIIQADHGGKVDALNKGYAQTDGEFIVSVDADTVVKENFLEAIIAPFEDDDVGAVSGPALVKNTNSVLGAFQNVEYYYNNLVRYAFSVHFATDVWFFGCLSAYRRKALDAVGGFSKSTMTEDLDSMLRIQRKGYKTLHTLAATGYTAVPETLSALKKQRTRWWGGGYQLIGLNKDVFWEKGYGVFRFIFTHHSWWAVYALLSVPLIAYQVWYWMPAGGLEAIAGYLFRWFTLLGPVWVLYKIPAGWLSVYNVFGISAGLLTTALLLAATGKYQGRVTWKDATVVFLYFPYTLILNMFILTGLYEASLTNRRYFMD